MIDSKHPSNETRSDSLLTVSGRTCQAPVCERKQTERFLIFVYSLSHTHTFTVCFTHAALIHTRISLSKFDLFFHSTCFSVSLHPSLEVLHFILLKRVLNVIDMKSQLTFLLFWDMIYQSTAFSSLACSASETTYYSYSVYYNYWCIKHGSLPSTAKDNEKEPS